MCGIAGKLGFHPGAVPSKDLLRKMCDAISHRGPDDAGYFLQGPVALGHRRLSIIDLASGHQPLSNEDDTVWVVFNGEIYNFVELREGLEAKGHRFRTTSDTEVIVHLYEDLGDAFVQHLRGMFAIALWDVRQRRLVLVRDRLGKKPLYYAVIPEHGLVFASEIKALLQDPSVPRALNHEALDSYMSLLYVPSPMSMFEGIRKLPAGHLLTWCDEKLAVKEYWDLTFEPGEQSNEQSAMEALQAIVQDAVRVRLRSDVPLGAFLSGGIDSSMVVRHMATQSSRPVVTCSVGFDEQIYNELPYAKEIAEYLHCEHHEHTIAPRIEEIVGKLAHFFDEPFADSSAVPTYYVSEIARRHVTVALSGDGGDEVFAGYSRHYLHRLDGLLRSRLGMLGCGVISRIARALPFFFKGQQVLARLGGSAAQACAKNHTDILFKRDLKRLVYSPDFAARCQHFDVEAIFTRYYNQCTATDPLDKALYVDIKTYLVDDILVKVDRMSMAHGLEVRAPLLDHKLIEFSATLPPSFKLRGRTTKYLLRQSLVGQVPQSVLTRQKHGFTMPLAEWLCGPLRPMLEDTLFSQRSIQRGLFNTQAVRKLCADHVERRNDYAHQLWQLLMLELWHQTYLDARGT
jgi:asparagine synthase (glutamine-hydrolysing)